MRPIKVRDGMKVYDITLDCQTRNIGSGDRTMMQFTDLDDAISYLTRYYGITNESVRKEGDHAWITNGYKTIFVRQLS